MNRFSYRVLAEMPEAALLREVAFDQLVLGMEVFRPVGKQVR